MLYGKTMCTYCYKVNGGQSLEADSGGTLSENGLEDPHQDQIRGQHNVMEQKPIRIFVIGEFVQIRCIQFVKHSTDVQCFQEHQPVPEETEETGK